VFDTICDDFEELLHGAKLHAIPLSALHGDNVITPSGRTPWFEGPPLLEYLETIEVDRDVSAKPFRFPVQLVLRPTDDFRGFAGQIVSGAVRRGDTVTVWPSGRSTRVARISTWDGDLEMAYAPMSITLVLEHEIDVSRGDVLASGEIEVGHRFEAEIVWMDERPLDPARVPAEAHHAHCHRGSRSWPRQNQIGTATVTTARPLIFDRYADNRGTGSFILIDSATHFTAGAGMIPESGPPRAAVIRAAKRGRTVARLARRRRPTPRRRKPVRRALEEIN
jgi:sulfate adenylyltransferase subunit 1 (EFTu-like GTPase family)